MQHFSESGAAALDQRLEALSAWVDELAGRVSATELATGDAKNVKELRRAIEALAKHDPKLESRLTERVDVLADRFAMLASMVSTTSAALARKDGEIASLRRELEEGGTRIQSLAAELGGRASVQELEKLRTAMAALSPQRGAPADQLDRVGGKLEWLSERVDTLAATVAATASGLAAREGELITLRQLVEQGAGELKRVAAETRQSPGLTALGARVDGLEREVAAGSERVAGREADLTALRARIDDAYAKANTVISDLQRSVAGVSARVGEVEALPARLESALAAHAGAFETRLEPLAEQARATTDRLGGLEAALSAQSESGDGRLRALETHRAETGERLDAALATVARLEQSLDADAWQHALDELSSRLDAMTAGLAATGERAAGQEGHISELRLSFAEIATRLGEIEALPPRLEESLASHAGGVEARLDGLVEGVRATTDGLRGLEATLSEQVRAASVRLGALESQRTEGETRLDAAAAAVERLEQALEDGGWERRFGALSGRLDAMKAELGATAQELVGRKGDIAALDARVDEVEKTGSLTSDLELSVQSLAARMGAVESLPETFEHALATSSAALNRRLQALAETASDTSRRVADIETASNGQLEHVVAALQEQLADVATTVERWESASPGDELGALRARIDEAYAKASSVIAELQLSLGALQSRVAAVETLPTLVEQAFAAHAGELATRLDPFAARLDRVEQGREVVTAEIDRVLDTWASDRSSLEARLEELSRAVARSRSETLAPGADSEVALLGALLDGLRTRVDSSEQELATLRSAPDLAASVDGVTRRLEALEHDLQSVFHATDGPVAGEGRFRLELRSLELRLEQAETEAREGRAAVLRELERLTSHVERRLARLETDEADAGREDQAPTGARVVPFRGAEV